MRLKCLSDLFLAFLSHAFPFVRKLTVFGVTSQDILKDQFFSEVIEVQSWMRQYLKLLLKIHWKNYYLCTTTESHSLTLSCEGPPTKMNRKEIHHALINSAH